MKTIFNWLAGLSGLIVIIGGIYQFGVQSKTHESAVNELKTEIGLLSQQLSQSANEVKEAKELALTAKIKADGVKSQADTLGKELKVDVETPFQQQIARSEQSVNQSEPTILASDSKSRPPIQVRTNDFLFESRGCERVGGNMTCKVLAVNLLDEDREIKLPYKSATLYDNNDDAAAVAKNRWFHGKNSHTIMVPSLSRSNLVYKFESIPKKSIPTSIGFKLEENGEFGDVPRSWLKK